jgi:hypothetical protein
LNIRLSKPEQDAQVQVHTVKGQLLVKQKITGTSHTLSLQGWAKGIYHVEVRNGNKVTTKWIVKN